MSEHLLETETTIPASRQSVFGFFSDASNLERLTPPSLGFQILTPLPIRMEEGALIDEQFKGPYRKWIHHHTFEETDSKMTCMRDRVRYALPFAPFGDMALPFVRAELRGIFDFRRKVILEIFSQI